MPGVYSHCAIEKEDGLVDHAANGAASTHKATDNTDVPPRHEGDYAIGGATSRLWGAHCCFNQWVLHLVCIGLAEGRWSAQQLKNAFQDG